tara:strand:- start:57 stop:254 length:198 start_codon:yes stop_codon:yes gene_type:complete
MSKAPKKEDTGITPNDRIRGTRNTNLSRPKYDPDGHLIRRDKDEEDFKGLLTDLIRKEIKKIFRK